MNHGFVKIAAATPHIQVADCIHNANEVIRLFREAEAQQADVVVFPELCLTGATCGDLLRGDVLLQGARAALEQILLETRDYFAVGVVGLPFAHGAFLYSCCAVFQKGTLLGMVPKVTLPLAQRHFFAPAPPNIQTIPFGKEAVPFGNLMFEDSACPAITFSVSMGGPETSPQAAASLMVLCPSATGEVVGQASYRQLIAQGFSAQHSCAVVWAEAGEGESTTDGVFSGHRLVAEQGKLLVESPRFSHGLLLMDIDTEQLLAERRSQPNTAVFPCRPTIPVTFSSQNAPLHRSISPSPFLPENPEQLAERCTEILAIQTQGLKKRIAHLLPFGGGNAVLGLSGGLDSTLALLVTANVFHDLQLDCGNISALSMPCFGTTQRTKNNAQLLAQELGVTFQEIPISKAVEQHFQDIGHNPAVHDVTFENAQARERTQVLMDVANQKNGIVIGTGDLSELALGWATYNGDHMSMYAVNSGVPKTLVRHLVRYIAEQSSPALAAVLQDILNTPVSPELLPPVEGNIAQKTEDLVGPYELHDFFLFYALRYQFSPKKIFFLATVAFAGQWEKPIILHWLKVFYRRFFSQQFKRSCLPDGPKVGTVGISPRWDWQMPSDACATLWLREIEEMHSPSSN